MPLDNFMADRDPGQIDRYHRDYVDRGHEDPLRRAVDRFVDGAVNRHRQLHAIDHAPVHTRAIANLEGARKQVYHRHESGEAPVDRSVFDNASSVGGGASNTSQIASSENPVLEVPQIPMRQQVADAVRDPAVIDKIFITSGEISKSWEEQMNQVLLYWTETRKMFGMADKLPDPRTTLCLKSGLYPRTPEQYEFILGQLLDLEVVQEHCRDLIGDQSSESILADEALVRCICERADGIDDIGVQLMTAVKSAEAPKVTRKVLGSRENDRKWMLQNTLADPSADSPELTNAIHALARHLEYSISSFDDFDQLRSDFINQLRSYEIDLPLPSLLNRPANLDLPEEYAHLLDSEERF